MSKIYVIVKGGLVQSAYSSNVNDNIEVVDFDTDDEQELSNREQELKDIESMEKENKLFIVY